MQRAFFHGAGVMLECGPLILALWLVSSLFGAGFAWASGYWLAEALDGSLATRSLLKDLDPNVFVDLYYHHGASFRMLLLLALLFGTAYVLLWFWFHGVVILMVRPGAATQLGSALAPGLHAAPLMGKLFLIAATVLAAFSLLVGLGARWLINWTIASPSEMTTYYIAGGAGALWLAGYVVLTAIHDHARIRACATAGGTLRAYRWALRFVLAGGERAVWLAVALHLTGVVLWVVYQTAGMSFPVTGDLGIAALFIWGELFLYARMALRVWFFAAQSALQPLG